MASSSTKLHQRFFFLFLALLFFCTAFALSFLVIWQGHQNSNASKAATAQANESNCLPVRPNPSVVNVKKKGATLQGSQLADFTPCKVSKLEAIDVVDGTGAAATSTDTITVDYTGAVAATGTIFQSSLDTGQPATFPLNQVIPGWTEGIPGMKVGGVRRLLIPAALAYGGNPPSGSGIPANADLVFDITLHKIGS
jgi:FKBP-type peptidyl-prolyl cis-trans isomerase